MGNARLTGPKSVSVMDASGKATELSAKNVIAATGASSTTMEKAANTVFFLLQRYSTCE